MQLLFTRQIQIGWLLLIVSSLIILPTQWLLTTPATPSGIADLELAGNVQAFTDILVLWSNDAEYGNLLWAAHASVWMDFLFLAAYTLLFHGFSVHIAQKLVNCAGKGVLFNALNRSLSWAAKGFLLAGSCDILENLCLLAALNGAPSESNTLGAALFASVKFLALFYGLILLGAGWVGSRIRGQRAAS